MSVVTRRRWAARFGAGAFVVLACSMAIANPVSAQSRAVASLGDVPALVPAPYHSGNITATYSAALYDGQSYNTGANQAGGAHYWH